MNAGFHRDRLDVAYVLAGICEFLQKACAHDGDIGGSAPEKIEFPRHVVAARDQVAEEAVRVEASGRDFAECDMPAGKCIRPCGRRFFPLQILKFVNVCTFPEGYEECAFRVIGIWSKGGHNCGKVSRAAAEHASVCAGRTEHQIRIADIFGFAGIDPG